MPAYPDFPSLADRTQALLGNIAIFYIAYAAVSGHLLLTGGLESVWLLSAAALWFLTLFSAPWFLPPRDGLVNAIGAASILITLDLTAVPQVAAALNALRWVVTAYCIGVMCLSLAALFLHDRAPRSRMAHLTFRLTGIFGKGEILYTPAALISILGAYQTSLPGVASLVVLWTFFIVCRPLERGIAAWQLWQSDPASIDGAPAVGTIDRIDHPNIVRVRLTGQAGWKPGNLYIAAMPDGDQHYVLALFAQVQGVEVIGTGLSVAILHEPIVATTGQVYPSHEFGQGRGIH